MMKATLLKFGLIEELDAIHESVEQRSSRSIRGALQFTWATMSAYLAWRCYLAWDQTQTIACVQSAALSTALLLLPIAGVSVAVAHLNRRINGL